MTPLPTDDLIQTLITDAIAASERAYTPYSSFHVGCALHSLDGLVWRGCNIESASYSPTICAERTALVKAVSEGSRTFDLCVIASRNGATPCGVCRQLLYEFAPDLRVVCVDFERRVHVETTLRDLLPYGFGPSELLGS